jgi:tetraacyldisaccharide 4'-kinase
MNPIRLLLFPFALLYGAAVWLRNQLYNIGVFHEHTFDVPTIVVGNLTVGGTGKTPHTEYLIKLLSKEYNIATLSRGYGRITNGFLLANTNSTHQDIGDEPRLFKHKFPDLTVSVDGNRVRGIQSLLAHDSGLDIILLDDAFQHRRVKPEVSILLTEYSKTYKEDYLLPVGNLREQASNSMRADVIIITKCPPVLSPLDRRALRDKIAPQSYQNVYFSYLDYGILQPVNPNLNALHHRTVTKALLFTGIANSEPLLYFLKSQKIEITHLKYGDHHNFTETDIEQLIEEFERINRKNNAIIITTEKDYMRMIGEEKFEPVLSKPLYTQPIEVKFHGEDNEEFNEQILNYVRRNKVHSNLSKKENKPGA